MVAFFRLTMSEWSTDEAAREIEALVRPGGLEARRRRRATLRPDD